MAKSTVMVVDDDSRLRDLLRLYLEKADFHVIEAENGLAALLLFQQQKPNILVLDIMMPVLDGLESLAGKKLAVAQRVSRQPRQKRRIDARAS